LAILDENGFGLVVPLVASNLDVVCDAKIILSLVCFIPMLEITNFLVKFAQFHNVFVYDLVVVMKIFQADYHKLYVDFIHVTFNDDVFQGFHGLVETNHDAICMKWIIDLYIGIDHMGFELNG
jgi:hypothetical protein